MEDILRLLNERERQSEDAFDNFSKTEPNNIDDWRQGYMYGLKEGRRSTYDEKKTKRNTLL